jgi:hypothetical protein
MERNLMSREDLWTATLVENWAAGKPGRRWRDLVGRTSLLGRNCLYLLKN